MHDVDGGGFLQRHALLRAVKVSLGHAGHACQAVRRPSSHAMRVLLGVQLHGLGRATVAVAFPKHGVHGGPLHLVVAGFDVGFLVRGRVVRVVRQVEAKALQFSNGSLQLRDGSADVGEFDDVRFRRFRKPTQFRQGVVRRLVLGQPVGHGGQDASAERNVTRFHGDACLLGKRLNKGKKTVSRQRWRFVRKGVENLRHAPAKVANSIRSPTSRQNLLHPGAGQVLASEGWVALFQHAVSTPGQHRDEGQACVELDGGA